MPVVQGVALSVGGTAIEGARVDIRLVASLTEEAAGYVGSTDREILDRVHTATDVTGAWSATLTANTLITPSNTYYEVVVTPPGGKGVVHQIVVPNGAGPYWVGDILYNGAGTLPTWPLDDHLSDLVDAHDASAVSYVPSLLSATTVQAAITELDTEKLGPVVRVDAYTGVPDGTTDNAQGFRDAIAAALTAGLPLVIPQYPNNYRVGSTVTITDASHLTVLGLSGKTTSTQYVVGGQVVIQGLAGLGQTPMFHVQTTGATTGTFQFWEGIQFSGAEIPMQVRQASQVYFRRCTFRSNGATGTDAAGCVLKDTFWHGFDGCTFHSDSASVPSVRLLSVTPGAAGGGNVYLVHFRDCRFGSGTVWYEQRAVQGGGGAGQLQFENCQTENVQHGLLRIINTSGSSMNMHETLFINCLHADDLATGPFLGSHLPLVELTDGSGNVVVNGLVAVGGLQGASGPIVADMKFGGGNSGNTIASLGNRYAFPFVRMHAVSDGAMTATSSTLTSATGGFTSAMVGMTIKVAGVGAAGATLTTTVAGFVDANTLTLTAAASTTASGQRVLVVGYGHAGGVQNKTNGFNMWESASALAAGAALMSQNGGAVIRVARNGEAYARAAFSSDGIGFGPGTGDYDTTWARLAAGVVGCDPGDCIRPGVAVTGSRPSAAAVGEGSMFFDATLNKPIWSDGAAWRDAAGTVV